MNEPQTYGVNFLTEVAAERSFERRFAGGPLARLRNRLSGRASCLVPLQKIRQGLALKAQRYAGVRSVPVDQIVGSEGRHCDFTADFRPRQEESYKRWVRIARAFLAEQNLPPVELIQVGDQYFVRDGHHRVAVARAFGQKSIDAQITVWDVTGEATD
jgi:hypothetical protein